MPEHPNRTILFIWIALVALKHMSGTYSCWSKNDFANARSILAKRTTMDCLHDLMSQIDAVKTKLTDQEYKNLVETLATLHREKTSLWEIDFVLPFTVNVNEDEEMFTASTVVKNYLIDTRDIDEANVAAVAYELDLLEKGERRYFQCCVDIYPRLTILLDCLEEGCEPVMYGGTITIIGAKRVSGAPATPAEFDDDV